MLAKKSVFLLLLAVNISASSIISDITGTANNTVSNTANILNGLLNNTVNGVEDVANDTVSSVDDTIGDVVNNTVNGAVDAANDTISNIGDTVNGTIDDTIDTISNISSSIVNSLLDDPSLTSLESILSIIENSTEDVLNSVLDSVLQELDLPLGTGLPVPELVEAYGYPIEIHEVTTEDGYILTLHRIPYGRNESNSSDSKSIAFLVPGILASSALFFQNTYEKNLPFALADQDYDVWLLNPRGNSYSTKHVNTSITEAQYYNFSFTQKGLYDVPASIDYVLNTTGESQLFYIGFSEGTTDFLVLTSEKPEYNEKIKLANLLAPVSYMEDSPSPFIQVLSPFKDVMQATLESLGIYSIGDRPLSFDILAIVLCNDLSPFQEVCYELFSVVFGYNPDQANKTLLPLFLTHSPDSSSIYEVIHYAQLVESGQFCNYDYGSEGNLAEYGTASPPSFNISNVVTPVALYYGLGDVVTSPTDVQKLANELPNLVKDYPVNNTGFLHTDFVLGINSDILVNDILIETLNNYK